MTAKARLFSTNVFIISALVLGITMMLLAGMAVGQPLAQPAPTPERPAAAQPTPAQPGGMQDVAVQPGGRAMPVPTAPAADPKGLRAEAPGPIQFEGLPTDARGEDTQLQNSKLAAILFWLFAAGVIGGALFVVTRRNMITAVMGMIGTFFALAGLYIMLYAHFLAAIQVLVYAGAIMVLFVFVVMILNRPEEEPIAPRSRIAKGLAGLATVYMVLRIATVLWQVKDEPLRTVTVGPSTRMSYFDSSCPGTQRRFGPYERTFENNIAGESIVISPCMPDFEGRKWKPLDSFGSVRAVGLTLFRQYLFPFEAVSLVLLVAVVGAIAVARPHHPEESMTGRGA